MKFNDLFFIIVSILLSMMVIFMVISNVVEGCKTNEKNDNSCYFFGIKEINKTEIKEKDNKELSPYMKLKFITGFRV